MIINALWVQSLKLCSFYCSGLNRVIKINSDSGHRRSHKHMFGCSVLEELDHLRHVTGLQVLWLETTTELRIGPGMTEWEPLMVPTVAEGSQQFLWPVCLRCSCPPPPSLETWQWLWVWSADDWPLCFMHRLLLLVCPSAPAEEAGTR